LLQTALHLIFVSFIESPLSLLSSPLLYPSYSPLHPYSFRTTMTNSTSPSPSPSTQTEPHPHPHPSIDTLLLQISHLHRRLDVQSNIIDLLTSTIANLQQRLVKTAFIVDKNRQSSTEDRQSVKSALDAIPVHINSLRFQCIQSAQRTDITLKAHARAIAQTHAYLTQQTAYKAMLSAPVQERPHEQPHLFEQGVDKNSQTHLFQLQPTKMHSRKRLRVPTPDDEL
ncbi:hypothetical protein NEOLI_000127, partial [Neolecta irregularis DAH-3]